MKYFIAGLVVVFVGLGIYWSKLNHSSSASVNYQVSEEKRMAVESETKVRPPEFEKMKWQPSTDIRTPATEKKEK